MLTYYCSCGAKLVGNGAKASHRRAHERRGEMRYQGGDVHSLNVDQWVQQFGEVARAKETK